MTMLNIRYGDSPLLAGDNWRVGRRAPNCIVHGIDGVERLHDLVTNGPCLLQLGGPETLVDGVRCQNMSREMAPVLFEELRVESPTAILLRPDGFVGLAADGLPEAALVRQALGDD